MKGVFTMKFEEINDQLVACVDTDLQGVGPLEKIALVETLIRSLEISGLELSLMGQLFMEEGAIQDTLGFASPESRDAYLAGMKLTDISTKFDNKEYTKPEVRRCRRDAKGRSCKECVATEEECRRYLYNVRKRMGEELR